MSEPSIDAMPPAVGAPPGGEVAPPDLEGLLETVTRLPTHVEDLRTGPPDVPARTREARRDLRKKLIGLDLADARHAFAELVRLGVWNRVQRVEDAVWDPRGKRALFEGLELERPRILAIDFVVADIRDLPFDREFDIVLSVGLLEHFPDEHKPVVVEWHRKFLKPRGYAIMTTPRRQWRSRAFYLAMGELMNYGYRELMDEKQMALYAYENGLEILRCGFIKAHNGLIARPR